jgi:hypothetical protein
VVVVVGNQLVIVDYFVNPGEVIMKPCDLLVVLILEQGERIMTEYFKVVESKGFVWSVFDNFNLPFMLGKGGLLHPPPLIGYGVVVGFYFFFFWNGLTSA